MDILDNLKVSKGAFGDIAEIGHGYITFPKLKGPLSTRMTFNGREKIVWSINNYLGLATHPEVQKADAEAAAEYSLAYPMGSRIMSGNLDEHELLERQLADFVGKEDAILFNYGYPGVTSSIDAILSRRDVVIYDEESHACIIDGVRLHLGKRMAFKHNDIDHLEKQLQKAVAMAEQSRGGILVISEGVFSMRGDQGKLKEIVELKKKYPFRLYIDDAHGFGVLGKNGAGVGEEQGITDEIDFYFATFAKSMASIGAFLAANKEVVKYLYYNTRSQVFAKSPPMTIVKGALKRLELVKAHPEFRERMWEVANTLREGLAERGLKVGDGASPITPVYLEGSIEEAKNVLLDLRETENIFCSGVIYPVVPKGVILFRLVPTALHTDVDVQETLDAFERVSKKLTEGYYQKHSIAPAVGM
ncbi:MAG: pyridoxal phosphate-dependent aminotransferase family protein [Saprospiraceae bacterium]|nr:pyridoxal phosphate-dependent aminotransferase family protein [Saprospiraceae bacterium]